MGGNKGRKQNNNKKNQKKKHQPVLVPLTIDEIDDLTTQFVQAISLLKISKDDFTSGVAKVGYVLSKSWFDQWKTHVGYDALNRGDVPSGKRYGRCKPAEINADIVSKDEEYHSVPLEYKYLDSPLRPDVLPIKDYMLISKECWDLFYSLYGGTKIERHRNLAGEFELKMVKPHVIFATQDLMKALQKVKGEDLQISDLNCKRIQLPIDWKNEQMQQYLRAFMSTESNFQVWKFDSSIPQDQININTMTSIHCSKYLICGDVLDLSRQDLKLGQLLKNHYTLLVECESYNFVRQEQARFTEDQGICEYCTQLKLLEFNCICRKAHYCCLKCKYNDQEFHLNLCPFAYDSEEDEFLEAITGGSDHQIGRGLVNLGNTCYMNSAIQSLFSSDIFQYFLINRNYLNGLNLEQDKRKIMLNFKYEKLLKNLIFIKSDSAFTPISFRSQFCKVHPYFGGGLQMDSAEFIYYLLDALCDEITNLQSKNIKKIQILEAPKEIEKEFEKKEESDDEDSGSQDSRDDKKEDEETQLINGVKPLTFEQQQKNKQSLELYDGSNPKSVWDNLKLNKSPLLFNNFFGLLESQIRCLICETVTFNYDPFLILPLPINHQQQFGFLEAFIVFEDWKMGYTKKKIRYDIKTTMVSEFKIQIAEMLNMDPMRLIGTITSSSYIRTYIFHEEDLVTDAAKQAINNDDNYLVFYEVEKLLHQMTEDEMFIQIEMFCKGVRPGFQNYSESLNISIPHLIIGDRMQPLSALYQKVFQYLGEHSKAQELMNFMPDQEEVDSVQDAFDCDKISNILGYQIEIQYKLPFKIKCPFECGKIFKKEKLDHQCLLPFNSKQILDDYLKAFNYKDGHITLVIDWQDNAPPRDFKIKFDLPLKGKNKESVQTLQQCFEHFQKEEMLQEENAYFCAVCADLSLAYKKISLHKAPNQLIIQLKRFYVDPIKGYFNKINSVVDYPIQLELAVQGVVERYTLYGVVIHFGSLDGGHYIAYGKRGDSWYEFDDERVSLKSIADVEGDGSAYLLMYQLMSCV